MDNKGFTPDLYDSTIEFWNISKEMMEWYRDLLGTEVIVTRMTDKDKRKSILSATLTSTFEDDENVEKFNWKILINVHTMSNVWRSANQLDIYDTVRKLETGDLIKFEYLGKRYQFKVTSPPSAYGLGAEICYQYTLTPILDHKI